MRHIMKATDDFAQQSMDTLDEAMEIGAFDGAETAEALGVATLAINAQLVMMNKLLARVVWELDSMNDSLRRML